MQFLSRDFSTRNPPASLHLEPKFSQYPTGSVALWPWWLLSSHPLCLAIQLRLTLGDPVACRPPHPQAPLFRGFSRQEYWSGLPCLPPGDLPNPMTEPRSPALLAGGFFTTEPPGKPKNTGVGSLSLLQGIFPTQEPGAPALQADSLTARLPGKPLICFSVDLYFFSHWAPPTNREAS